jgi:hypothetical protein
MGGFCLKSRENSQIVRQSFLKKAISYRLLLLPFAPIILLFAALWCSAGEPEHVDELSAEEVASAL